MPPRTREERLFGAACLRVQLEKSGGLVRGTSGIYEGALRDLDLTDDEVSQFLQSQRGRVEQALSEGKSARARPSLTESK